MAETSSDVSTRAAALFWTQKYFIRVADPDIDLTNITTIEEAEETLTRLTRDPEAVRRLQPVLIM